MHLSNKIKDQTTTGKKPVAQVGKSPEYPFIISSRLAL
jgi:hypothetical protein